MKKNAFALSSAMFPSAVPSDWEECRSLGFSAAELSLGSHGDCLSPADCFRVGDRVAGDILSAGLELWTVHIPYGEFWDPSAADPAEQKENCRRIVEVLEQSARWGAKGAVLHGSAEPVPLESEPRKLRLEHARESTAFLAEKAAELGLFLAIEDLPRSCLGSNIREMEAILGNSAASICFDVNHLLQDSHQAFLEVLGSRIKTLHLSDYDFIDECHWLPGDGKIDWPGLMAGLEAAGYEGPLLFEISRRRLPNAKAAEILAHFRQAVSREN